MYFLSVSLVVLVFSCSRAKAATNSSSPADLTDEDLVRVSAELVARYRADIQKLQTRLVSFNDTLQPLLKRNVSLTAALNQKFDRMDALYEIREAIDSKLNYPPLGSDGIRMKMTYCDDKYDAYGRHCSVQEAFEDSNPITALDSDITQLNREIAAAEKSLATISDDIKYTSYEVAFHDLLIKKKKKLIEILTELYGV